MQNPPTKTPLPPWESLTLLWSDFRQASDAPHAKKLYSYSLGSIFNVCDVPKSENWTRMFLAYFEKLVFRPQLSRNLAKNTKRSKSVEITKTHQ